MSIWYYVVIVSILAVIVFYASGCKKKDDDPPTPTPPPVQPEVPPEIEALMSSPEEIARWGRRNFALQSDSAWSGHPDYPLSPAEFFMNRIKCVRCYNHIINHPRYAGDCNTVNPLNAYFLAKLGYEAYVGIIPNFSGNISHMIAWGYKNEKLVVFNNFWLYTKLSKPDDLYPDKPIRDRIPIKKWLDDLYAKGHHKYYTEVV